MDCSMPGFPVHHQLPKLAQTLVHWVSDAIQSSHPLLLSIFPNIRVFSNELTLPIKWPKYWSFRSSISPSNEYSRLISLRIDWFDLLAVQGTLKSLLQHHSFKASTLTSVHDYSKNTRQTFVGKVMSLLFNMLYRLVIAFLSRRKCLFISNLQWFWSPRK